MVAILNGDLVNSASVKAETWMPVLKRFLQSQGATPVDWEIFRGDAFQCRCHPEQAFYQYLLLKSMIKQIADLDVRVSIGIGDISYDAAKITESNGPAFVRSGRAFDKMKEKQYLVFSTGAETVDRPLNLLAGFASLIMDNWTPAAAETVQAALEHPGWNQQQIAEKLQINQSAVSQNRKRAQLDLILEMNEYYKTVINTLAA